LLHSKSPEVALRGHKPLRRHVRSWPKPTPLVAARAALRNLARAQAGDDHARIGGDMHFISRLMARPTAV
jgi:hypothetical protein